MCLVAANVVTFPSNKIEKLKQMWLFLNVHRNIQLQLLTKFHMISVFAFYFWRGRDF